MAKIDKEQEIQAAQEILGKDSEYTVTEMLAHDPRDVDGYCPFCDYVPWGSHYHCPDCGEICSMMGCNCKGG